MRVPVFILGLILAILPGAPQAAELLMVERHGCHWCERWNAVTPPK